MGIFLLGQPGTGWYQLKLGGGGQVLTIRISPDGLTKLITTDVGGGYIFNGSGKWDQLINSARMPGAYVGQNNFMNGVYAINVAPTNSSVIYMAYNIYNASTGTIFKSTDGGATFAATAFTPVWFDSNVTAYKFMGSKLEVDPANSNVVYFSNPLEPNASTVGRTYVTVDGGATWTTVPNVPSNSGVPNTIVFDPNSGTSGSGGTLRTVGIYISSEGNGIYHSTDSGVSFSLMSGSPTSVGHIKCTTNGILYTAGLPSQGVGSVHRYNGSWATKTPPSVSGNGIDTIVVSPFTPANLIAVEAGGKQWGSTDNGDTWSLGGKTNFPTRIATDVPWLAVTTEDYLTVGELVMDPITANKVWFAEGIGVWHSTSVADPVVYNSQTAGIEELVAHWIISPPSGDPLVCCSDRSIFRISNPDVYPSDHGVSHRTSIMYSSSCDWASATPGFIVDLCEWSGDDSSFSSNGGTTWTKFTGTPGLFATNPNGCIAASTTTNFVMVPANHADPYYTTDQGATWNRVAASVFGNGMRDAAVNTLTITGAASGTGGNVRLTVTSAGTVQTDDQGLISGVVGTTEANGFHNLTRVDSTHVEIDVPFVHAYVSGGSLSSTVITGWGRAYFLNRQIVCSDRVNANTFYIYNCNTAALGGGVYKTTNSGAAWTRVFSGPISGTTANNARLRTVPNLSGSVSTAGHLFFSAGQGDSTSSGLTYGIESGGSVTFNQVVQTGECIAFGFGAVKAGNNYPSLYYVGVINSVYGIFRSDSSAAQVLASNVTPLTWTNLTAATSGLPLGSTDLASSIEGDANTWAKAYVSYSNGCLYYKP